ncbi:flagellar basal body-associated FliL family protein [Yoonia sp. BS5-3]|uniref:Flagellar basal body-associated FliL family protein n=1 Tax=Yoonia phaeophyticola TaxID=3137369 RepID=A0ABZ2V4K3_9RHOB
MKKLLLPILLLLVGVGSGVGAGLVLKPEPLPDELAEGHPCGDPATMTAAVAPEPISEAREYAKLSNQFIVPVVEQGRVSALVVLSLSIEVTEGNQPAIFAVEPKLRDGFLQVMFDHANIGGFSGNFTAGTNMRALRNDLMRVARDVSGDIVTDVLIIDIVRQDS